MLHNFKKEKFKKYYPKILGVFFAIFLISIPIYASAQFFLPWNAISTVSTVANAVNPEAIFFKIVNNLLASLSQLLLIVSSWIIYAAGEALEVSMQVSVSSFSTYANNPGVKLAWETFRNIANMAFIFILLYIAIGTILGLSNINTKKMLARVIIIALLLNFSFFFTRVIIDVSNLLAVGFFNQVTQTQCTGGPAGSIAGAFMCKMGINSVYSPETFENLKNAALGLPGWDGAIKILAFGILGSIFMIIAAFVFGAACIMFIARTVILIFLILLSPLAFIAMALPTDKYSKEWWGKLFDQCIFAPAFLAFIWAVLQIVGTLNINPDLAATITGVTDANGLSGQPAPGAGQTFLNFGIIIALIITALVVAKRTGAYGAGGALRALGGAGKWAKRQTIRGAAYWPQYGIAKLDEAVSKRAWSQTAVGSTLRAGTTEALAKLRVGGKTAVERKKEIDVMKTRYQEISKADRAIAAAREVPETLATAKAVRELAERETDAEKKATLIKRAQEAEEKAVSGAQRLMTQLSPRAVTELGKSKLFDPEIMRHSTTAQYMELMKSDKFTEDEKKKISEARNKYIQDAVSEYGEAYDKWMQGIAAGTIDPDDRSKQPKLAVHDDIRRKGAKELETLNQYAPDMIRNPHFVNSLRSQAVKDIRNSEMFTQAEGDLFREMKYKTIIDASDNLAKAQAELESLPATEMSKLPEKQRAVKTWERMLNKALLGKNAQEVADMPGGKGWKKKPILQRLDRSMLPKFADKDAVDRELIVKHFISEAKLHKDGKKDMTYANKKAVEWILNIKEGRNFFPPLNDELRNAVNGIDGIQLKESET